MLENIIRIANSRGFSVETISSPYGDYTLKDNEIAFLCNCCGEAIIYNLSETAFEYKINHLVCKNSDCRLENDFIFWTQKGLMSWCYDNLKIISSIRLTEFNFHIFENGGHFNFPEEGNKDVYIAKDPNNEKFVFCFVVYHNENDSWLNKYLLFGCEISSYGLSPMNVNVYFEWPYYYEQLHKTIIENIHLGFQRNAVIDEKTFDAYVEMYHAISKNNQDFWHTYNLCYGDRKISEEFDKNVDEEFKDVSLRKFLNLHSCPICRKPYMSTQNICKFCSFPELNKQFMNKADAEYWHKSVVEPYKTMYEKRSQK